MSATSSTTDPAPPPAAAGFACAAFAFVTGLWLALLQCSYFFLLEARLTSRATSFFVALFFWLLGFLAGLNLPWPRAFPVLLAVAPAAYYAALALLGTWPYRLQVLPLAGLCIAVAGALAGAFFPFAERRFPRLNRLLLHENNGFVVGLVLALIGSVFHGRFLLEWVPALGFVGVLAALLLSRRRAD